MRPLYIALEGIEGCGKTTQAGLLAAWLGAQVTKESGGTDIGGMIRQIVVHHPGGVDPWCEALLFAADRAQHIREVVSPRLGQGHHVVSDRSLWSSIAYQGYGRELDVNELYRINSTAVGGVFPTLVFELVIDVLTMKRRLDGRLHDRIEQAGDEFFERVIDGFGRIRTWADCERWVVIDAKQPETVVQNEMREAVESFMAKWWA